MRVATFAEEDKPSTATIPDTSVLRVTMDVPMLFRITAATNKNGGR